MKSLPAPLAVALCLTVGACGSSRGAGTGSTVATASRSTTTTSAPPVDFRKADADKDNDLGAYQDERNNGQALSFGQPASLSDRQAITALLRRYYTAAVSDDGAKACSMLYSTLEESVAEDYGTSAPSQPYMAGKTCSAVLTGLFKHFHAQLVADRPALKVRHVGLVQHQGLAVLSFGTMPEREIIVRREGHVWKVSEILDVALP